MIFFLLRLGFNELPFHGPGEPSRGPAWEALWLYGGWAVSGIAVALTLYSGFDYLWKHRAMLRTD